MAITWKNFTANYGVEQKTYDGAVLAVKVDNSHRIMSDVWGTADYAFVWDDEKNQPVNILLNVWEYTVPENTNVAVVDATDEVKAKYQNYLIQQKFEQLVAAAEAEAAKIVKDDTVTVVSGRYAKGVTGKVVAIIQRPYGQGYYARTENKLAVATSDEKIKVAAKNGKVYENYKDVEWVWARNVKKVNKPVIDTEVLMAAAVKTCK